MKTNYDNEQNGVEEINFYDVASRFVKETTESSKPHQLLKQWAKEYPQYAAELADLAYSALVAPDATLPDEGLSSDAAVVESARHILGRSISAEKPPIKSLVVEAKTAGISVKELADYARIDLTILAKLEQRLLNAATVPQTLVQLISTALRRQAEDVIAYLRLPPQLARSANYKSKRPPSLMAAEQQSFEEALSGANALRREYRDYWLDELGTGNNASGIN